MSKVVDSRVVEMRFDNAQFEKGVSTTMSTLDKLKQKLNLSGASKGLEDIHKSVKNTDFSAMHRGIETATLKFSALQIAGITAINNITNSAMRFGKNIVKALTLDPVTTGLDEYETKINAIQTIMSNTANKGTTMSDVTKVIDELNTYADKTIYNFAEMTRNIGTFTAAGVGLEDAASAIKGIANLAAASGSSSQQAATAMYQLSQALAAGRVNLMDWNSVVNAGMGGEKFQLALKDTAKEMGIVVDETKSFRDSIHDGWLTADVLNQTLRKFTVEGAKEYSQAMMESGKWTQAQADALIKEAQAMEDAATKVKTFTQLWSTLKESAQSGWGKTWELIIGDFEKAKDRLTEMFDIFGGFINNMSDTRNNFLESALSSKWDILIRKLNVLGVETESFQNKIKELAKNHNVDLDSMIEKEGSFEKALQKTLSSGVLNRGVIYDSIKSSIGGVASATEQLTEAQIKQADSLARLSDEQLKSKGYTEEQISALRFLSGAADQAGMSIKDLVSNLEEPSGAELLWESIFDIIHSIAEPIKAIGAAWRDIFGILRGDVLYGMIEGLNEFTGTIKNIATDTENLDKLTRSFRGLFAILDIVTTFIGGGFKIAFSLLSEILGRFDLNILDVTATLGDLLVAFRDFVLHNQLVEAIFEALVHVIEKVIDGIKKLVKAFTDLPQVQKIIEKLQNALEGIKDIDLLEIGRNIVQGLQNGISSGIDGAVEAILNIGRNIIESFCSLLGIHSPSTVFFEFGRNIVEGLGNGITSAIEFVLGIITRLGESIINAFNCIDWNKISNSFVNAFEKLKEFGKTTNLDKILSFIPVIAMGVFVKKLLNIGQTLADGVKGFNDVLDGIVKGFDKISTSIAGVFTSLSGILNSMSFSYKAEAFRDIAIAIGIIVASVIALSFIDIDGLFKSLTILTILSGLLIGLTFAIDKLSAASVSIGKNGINLDGLKLGLLQIGIVVLLLAGTVKLIGSMDIGNAIQGFVGLVAIMGALMGFMFACQTLATWTNITAITTLGSLMLKLSVALFLMVGVIKLISILNAEDMVQGAAFAAGFAAFVYAITNVTRGADKNITKVGWMMIQLSIAMGLMVGVVKMVSLLSAEDMLQGIAFASAFVIFVGALTSVTKIGKDKEIAKLGGMLLTMSASMALMVGVVKLVGLLSPTDVIKGVAFVSSFLILVKVMVSILTIGNDVQMAKIGATILSMSMAIGVLAGIATLLSFIPIDGLAKGVVAITMMGAVMTAMIWATRGASDAKKNLITMSIAIATMTSALLILSTIDTAKLMASATSLSSIMGLFALITKISGNGAGVTKNVFSMILVVGALSTILFLLSSLPVESSIGNSASLSLLLLSLSTSLFILGKAETIAPKALMAIGVMTAVVAALAVILGVLASCNVGPTLEIATSLSMLILSLSASCAILSAASAISPLALAAAGVMTAVVAALAVILGVLASCNVGPTLEIATSLSLLLLSLSACCVILEVAGLAGLAALFGVAALTALIIAVGGLMLIIGGLVTLFPGLEEVLNKGIPLLQSIGEGLGAFYGGIVQGFIGGVGEDIAEFGTHLLNFMTNLQSFLDAASNIDESAVTRISNLSKALLMITGAELLNSITSFVFGEDALTSFGEQLKAFATAITDFSNILTNNGGVDESAITAAANAGMLMLELQNKVVPQGGVVQWFAGQKNLGEFGSQLKTFGTAIVDFSNTLSENGGINEGAITAAASAGTLMAQLQSNIEPIGGVVSFFTGVKDLGLFGSQLSLFGDGIVKFSNTLSQNGGINEEAITTASSMGTLMSELQSKLEPMGGVISFFTGRDDLGTFGEKLAEFGKGLKSYSDSVVGLNVEPIHNSISAATELLKLSDLINADGASFSERFNDFLFGESNPLVDFGNGLSSYANSVANIDFAVISSSVTSAKSLVDFIKNIGDVDTSGISSLKNALEELGTLSVDGFINAFKGASSNISDAINGMITSALSAVNNSTIRFMVAGASLVGAFSSGVTNSSGRISSVFTSSMQIALLVISSRIPAFSNAGNKVGTSFADGITSKIPSVTNAVQSMVSAAVSAIGDHYNSFYSAGANLARGFANGISANSYMAAARASAMAASAARAAERELDIHSPSRVFVKIGSYIPKGFAKGITLFGGLVKRSVTRMSDKAVKTTRNAISLVDDMLSLNYDSQPTIKPVVDLSNVKNGALAINGMFDKTLGINTAATIDSIGSVMNRRNQNGINDDVVMAIDKLRKDIDNLPNVTYQIGGVTYDDGSNVSEAVKALIGAIKVERRK